MTTLDRRTVLRGIGATVALPFLEAMLAPRASAGAAGATSSPRRLAFVYVPNGVHGPAWRPSTAGPEFELTPTLEPLAPFREHTLVVSGLVHDKARANGDGPGDHARASAAFLTGCQPLKADGSKLRVGVSVDQVAAARIGTATRFRSLEIGVEGGGLSGSCDSGYPCAYSSNLSWSTPHTPCPKETDPRVVFDRLFRDGDARETADERARRLARRARVVDLVRVEAKALERRLGAEDRRKLEQYQDALAEVERRLEAAANGRGGDVPDTARPARAPADYREHLRLLADVLVLAFRTDSTRIATFSFANEGSNRGYAFLGAPEGHHDLSHHGGEADKLEKLARINRFHVEQLAYLLEGLRAAREADGDLLAHTAIVYGSGIGDGNRHNHDDLPILVVGGAGGRLAGGRHLVVPKETPVANLYVSLLAKFDVPVARHGDSTGTLEGI